MIANPVRYEIDVQRLTPLAAANVLYVTGGVFEPGGIEPSSWCRKLIELLLASDFNNIVKAGTVWPDYAAAVDLYKNFGAFSELRRVAAEWAKS